MSEEDEGHDSAGTVDALEGLRPVLPERIPEVPSKKVYPVYYSRAIAERVKDEYIQGQTLHAISRLPGMPSYATLLRWSKEHAQFAPMLRSVRETRALHFEDKAIDAAEMAQGKDGDRLRFEAYKWAAEVNDPSVYGKKVAHSGDSSNPIQIQVVTGFGPPNRHQTPPKLLPDGTIDKSGSPAPGEEEMAEVLTIEESDEHRAGTDDRTAPVTLDAAPVPTPEVRAHAGGGEVSGGGSAPEEGAVGPADGGGSPEN